MHLDDIYIYIYSNTCRHIVGKMREICPIEMYTKKHQPQRISEVHLQDPKVFRWSFYHHLYHLSSFNMSSCLYGARSWN